MGARRCCIPGWGRECWVCHYIVGSAPPLHTGQPQPSTLTLGSTWIEQQSSIFNVITSPSLGVIQTLIEKRERGDPIGYLILFMLYLPIKTLHWYPIMKFTEIVLFLNAFLHLHFEPESFIFTRFILLCIFRRYLCRRRGKKMVQVSPKNFFFKTWFLFLPTSTYWKVDLFRRC